MSNYGNLINRLKPSGSYKCYMLYHLQSLHFYIFPNPDGTTFIDPVVFQNEFSTACDLVLLLSTIVAFPFLKVIQ